MRTRAIETLFRHAAAFAAEDRTGPNSDGELYEAFRTSGSDAAFALIIHRHGPMVWGVCRNLLAEAEAEDAFQATFLALVRSRSGVRTPAALGSWLHRVAVRVAVQASQQNRHRRLWETTAAVPESSRPVPDGEWGKAHAAVHEEIDRLPPRLRELFVLCVLEGVRPTDAAACLGLKLGTVTGLIARARQRLLDRLRDRELTPALAGGIATLVGSSGQAGIPPAMFESAMTLIRTDAAAGVSSTVVTLARAATETSMTRMKLLAAAVMIGTALSAGVGGSILSRSVAQDQGRPAKTPPENNPHMMPGTTLWAPQGATSYYWSKPTWEFKVIALKADPQAELAPWASDGWDLVSVAQGPWEGKMATLAFLKRPKAQAAGSTVVPTGAGETNLLTMVGRPSVYTPLPAGFVTEVPKTGPQYSVVRLRHVSATVVAKAIAEEFAKDGFEVIVADESSNTLVLKGSAEKVMLVKTILEKLDKKPEGPTGPAK
jgi:RNA polymerase sigma factor (sigma-70 family)